MKKLKLIGKQLTKNQMLLVNGNGYGSYECNNGSSGHGPVSSQSDLDGIATRGCSGHRGGVKNTLCSGCGIE